ncbi:ATP-binding cassette domain-containing protein [Bradyrhizobium diazoefficiens]|uniref:ATP-binding cassette domain-containing protein n=1 Tax=Bradyrhizobium diazoefficiens TaxID=1355477 RepID=UPI00384B7FE7
MAGLTLRGIHKAFGDTSVLNDIDLDIADGEFLTLVGPSGCGKSTLLRIIAGPRISGPRLGVDRRDFGGPYAASRAQNRHGVPELRALSPHVGVRQHSTAAHHDAPQPVRAPALDASFVASPQARHGRDRA